jgi:hypothetical protein
MKYLLCFYLGACITTVAFYYKFPVNQTKKEYISSCRTTFSAGLLTSVMKNTEDEIKQVQNKWCNMRFRYE